MNKLRLRLASLLGLLLLGAQGVAANPPNIIFILADDLGYGDLGCYGHPKFKTPAIDRLAASGAKLLQFNAPTPYCAPARAALLTGRYPFRTGMTINPAPDANAVTNQAHLDESEITLPQLLTQAGYATGMIGKWHLGHASTEWMPTHRGFQEYTGILYSNDMRPVTLYEGDQPLEYPVIQANLTKRYTARALDFIKRHQHHPFFLYFAHATPHKPIAASEAFYKKSGAGLYGDAMAELDWSVDQVLTLLDELGLAGNTLVIFASDNGPSFGGDTGGLRGYKSSSYEGGFRVPCIARWPGVIPAGHVSSGLAGMMDLFPTLLQVAQVAPPGDRVIDGRDILPLFTSDAPSPHDYLLGQVGRDVAFIRNARWKLHVVPAREGKAQDARAHVHWIDPRAPDGVTIIAPAEQYQPVDFPGLLTGAAPAPMQLFDLQADPGEQNDVTAQHPEVVARLREAYGRLVTPKEKS